MKNKTADPASGHVTLRRMASLQTHEPGVAFGAAS